MHSQLQIRREKLTSANVYNNGKSPVTPLLQLIGSNGASNQDW